MADNIHPVVKLLAARMESHPEEFPVNPNGQLPIGGRWSPWLAQAEHLMNDAERTLIYDKAKEVIFQRIHEEVMDELLNGEERREEERRRKEADEQRYLAQLSQIQMQTQNAAQANPYLQAQKYRDAMGLGQNALAGLGVGTAVPSQPLVIHTSGQEAMRIEANGELRLGGTNGGTLNAGMLRTIKQKLGI